MKTVKISVTSSNKASRWELLVRILWAIICGIVLFFFSIIACICAIIQWLYILITGKRSKSLNNLLKSYVIYRAQLNAYLYMLTDERNPILPGE